MRRILTFVVVAAAGLAAAVGVTVAATAITDQEIGLDSEPITAGRELAPPAEQRPRTQRDRPRTTTQPRATPSPPPRTTTAPPPPPPPDDVIPGGDDTSGGDDSGGDDGSGRGRGRGRGRGGDDDD